jgi:peptide alpha-N-acetyltransferase
MHAKAQLLLELGRLGDAERVLRQLLARNPDDYRVHEGLHRCLGIAPAAAASSSSSSAVALWSPHSGKKRRVLQRYSAGERDKLAVLYAELAAAYPSSLAVQRVPLDFLVGGCGGGGGGRAGAHVCADTAAAGAQRCST